MRTRLAAVLLLIPLAVGAAAGATPAGAFGGLPASIATAKPKACKKGTLRWTVNRKARCVRTAAATRRPSTDSDRRLAALSEFLTTDRLAAAVNRTKGAKLAPRTQIVNRALGRGGARRLLAATSNLRAIARSFKPLRMTIRFRPRAVTVAPVGGNQTFTGPNGERGSINLDTGAVSVTQPLALGPNNVVVGVSGNILTGDLHFSTTFSSGRFGGGLYELRTRNSAPLNQLSSCPGADGTLKGNVGYTQERTLIEYAGPRTRTVKNAETDTLRLVVAIEGKVGDDAYLNSAKLALTAKKTQATSRRTGPFSGLSAIEDAATATATVDPAAMRAAAARPYAVGSSAGARGTAVAISLPASLGDARAQRAAGLIQGALSAEHDKLVADGLKYATDALRKAEEYWRTPNNCVQLLYEPAPGGDLGPGESKPVSLKLLYNPNNSNLPATFKRTALSRGELSPAAVAPPTPEAKLTAKGQQDAKPGEQSVSATFMGTSRAGIATRDWDAKAPKAGLAGTISVRYSLAPDGPGTGSVLFSGDYQVRSSGKVGEALRLDGAGDESLTVSYGHTQTFGGDQHVYEGSGSGEFRRVIDEAGGSFFLAPHNGGWRLALSGLDGNRDFPLTKANLKRTATEEACNPGPRTTTTTLAVGGGSNFYRRSLTSCDADPPPPDFTEQETLTSTTRPASLWSESSQIRVPLCGADPAGAATLCPAPWSPGQAYTGSYTSTPRRVPGGVCLTGFAPSAPGVFSNHACVNELWKIGWTGSVTISWNLQPAAG